MELSGSEDEDTSSSEEESDSDEELEVTEQNLKLPGAQGKKRKVNIQVLEQQ